ncbi:hypothetical protein THAOC_05428, partial [Thalassiosira oceanica]
EQSQWDLDDRHYGCWFGVRLQFRVSWEGPGICFVVGTEGNTKTYRLKNWGGRDEAEDSEGCCDETAETEPRGEGYSTSYSSETIRAIKALMKGLCEE